MPKGALLLFCNKNSYVGNMSLLSMLTACFFVKNIAQWLLKNSFVKYY